MRFPKPSCRIHCTLYGGSVVHGMKEQDVILLALPLGNYMG